MQRLHDLRSFALASSLVAGATGCGTGAANSETLPAGYPSGVLPSTTADVSTSSTLTSATSSTGGQTMTDVDPSEHSSADSSGDTTTGPITGTSDTDTSSAQGSSPDSGEGDTNLSAGDTMSPECGDGIVDVGEECEIRDSIPDACFGCILDRRVFVTSIRYYGDMSYEAQGEKTPVGVGVARADNRCKQIAASALLPRPDRYIAWINGATGSATRLPERLSDGFKGRYVSTETQPVVIAYNWEDLVDSNLQEPISHDEGGSLVTQKFVWTNTRPDGTRASILSNCLDWESKDPVATVGNAGEKNGGWTQTDEPQKCSAPARLYCFEGPPPQP